MELIALTTAELGAYIGQFLWPFFRIAGFLMVAPVIGSQLVPARIRMVIALMMTVIIVPVLPEMPKVEGLSLQGLFIVGQQVLVGVALGFFMQLMFHTLVLAGQMIAMQMGLGFASMVDPSNGINVTVVSTFYLLFITILFVSLDGHLTMLKVIADSFYSLPINTTFTFANTSMLDIVASISWIFSSAMVIALPALTALLITNFAFGIMTRAAPQLNIFALGFPVSLLFGMFLIWLTLPAITNASINLFDEGFIKINQLINP